VAWVELKLGRLSKALNYVTMAVNGARQDPIINYHAGVISAKAGRTIAAIKYLSIALELGLQNDYKMTSEHLLRTLRSQSSLNGEV
jgi:hypothetical protein